MKRCIVFGFLFLGVVTTGLAQETTTMWPYRYPVFRQGTVHFKDHRLLEAQLNVHLLKSTLHYLDKEQIKEANSSDIVVVRIGHDTYYVSNSQLLRVIAGDSAQYVAELVLADFDAIMSSGGAYGSSSNVQATRKLSSMEIGGVSITNHMELKNKKDGGTLLPLFKKFVIVTADTIYTATRKGIESQLPETKKAAFKQFVKENKINWKDPASLAVLLDLL